MEQKPLIHSGSLLQRTHGAAHQCMSPSGGLPPSETRSGETRSGETRSGAASTVDSRLNLVQKGLKTFVVVALLGAVSAQSAYADIVDQFNTLGEDVEAWANILIPTVIVLAFIAVIFYVVTSSPRWRGALAVFVVALILWGGLDEIVTWAHKIGGGDGTVNIVGGSGGGEED